MTHSIDEPAVRDQILPKAAVAAWLGVSQCTIDRWSREGRFPQKLQLGPARVGWQQSDVEAWLAQKKATGRTRT